MFVVAEVPIGAIGLVGLHPGAFVCFVTAYNATRRRSQYSVVAHIMARDATDHRTFEATFAFAVGAVASVMAIAAS